MTAADWISDLARHAEAATPGPWHVHEMGKVFVGNGAPGSLWQIVHMSGDDLADLTDEAADRERADAEFIAAASPATILRLIAENRDLSERLAQAYRDEVLAHDERDALAARLAAVEALHRPRQVDAITGDCATEECDHEDRCPTVPVTICAACDDLASNSDPYHGERGLQHVLYPCATRAALSAAPTDTTKETDR